MYFLAIALLFRADTATNDLLALLKAEHGRIADVEFNFEGNVTGEMKKSLCTTGHYTGRCYYQAATGNTYVETGRVGLGDHYVRSADSWDGELISQHLHDDKGAKTPNQIRGTFADGVVLQTSPTPFAVFLAPALRVLQYDPYTPPCLKATGTEQVNGVDCQRLELEFVAGRLYGPITRHPQVWTYWLDMAHGGNIVQFKYSKKNRLIRHLHSVKLGKFPDGKGATIWLPTFARCDEFGAAGDKNEMDAPPPGSWRFEVVTDSVRVNAGKPVGPPVVEFDRNHPVSDYIQMHEENAKLPKFKPIPGLERKFTPGTAPDSGRLTEAQIKAVTDAGLSNAPATVRQPKSRSGTTAYDWLGYGLLFVGGVGLAFVLGTKWRG